MRIIAGSARRRVLETLPGDDVTRPTGERVKEGLFSAIQFELEGRRVLDLFCGSGQLALEALSRGAESAVMIDDNVGAVEVIKNNAKNTGLMKQCRISRMDYSEYLKSAAAKGEKFDLVFLDPPYAKQHIIDDLEKMVDLNLLNDQALIVAETNQEAQLPTENWGSFEFLRQQTYGITVLTIYRFRKDEA